MADSTLTYESTSKFVNTRSWRLHYNEAGTGHPVIMLHGSGAGATGWSNFAPNIPELAKHFRVIALDAPGWGKSDAALAEDYDHPNAVLELMDALGLEKAALVGNSLGGSTSITFASRNHDRISHLITMGAGSLMDIPTMSGAGNGPSEGLKILFQAYREPTLENMMKVAQIMTFDSSNATPGLAQQRLENALANPEHLSNFLASLATGGPARNRASHQEVMTISAPTLLIHGRDDRVVHYEYSLRLLPLIKQARLVLLNGCGHWAQLEHTEAFNRMVIDFITNE